MAGASTMTSTGYGAMPSYRMCVWARCSRQIEVQFQRTIGLHSPVSARQDAQYPGADFFMADRFRSWPDRRTDSGEPKV
jgi:hypothetical protein